MSTQPDWHDESFDFDKYGEGAECRVKTSSGDEYVAHCYKHHPFSDDLAVFTDDWITNDPRCEDKKNGRIQVVAWLPPKAPDAT